MAKDMPDYICITTPSQSRKCTEGFEAFLRRHVVQQDVIFCLLDGVSHIYCCGSL